MIALLRPRARAVLAGALALGLVAPAAASAEPTFTFTGRGYGHGVGLSQYGARGAALAGWSAQQILAHYYPGTTLAPAALSTVRVRLAEAATRLTIGADLGGTLTSATGVALPLAAGFTGTATLQGTQVAILDPAGAELWRGTAPLLLKPSAGGSVVLAGRRYRGTLTISAAATAGRLNATNTVGLEDYLAGVVPREMPASWGDRSPAALDAQAVAARSYAMATRRLGLDFDMYADTRSQVYGGRDGEDPRTTAAVQRTRGQVLTFLGQTITAFFFSTSGGRTENVENAWGGRPLPYLVSVEDPYDTVSPYHRWPKPPVFGASSLGRRLGLGQPVATVKILARGASPRVKKLRVTGVRGAKRELTGSQVRASLGLLDTWFSVKRKAG